MALDLDRDVTINGHLFKAGKGVDTTAIDYDKDGKEVKTDYADAIKDVLPRAKAADEFASTHHGAVDYDGPKDVNEILAESTGDKDNKKGNKN